MESDWWRCEGSRRPASPPELVSSRLALLAVVSSSAVLATAASKSSTAAFDDDTDHADSSHASSFIHNAGINKATVDYISPALCTPVTLFPPMGDAAYHQHAGGLSHGHRQHAPKIWKFGKIAHVVREISSRTDRQTDILITILCNRSRGQSNQEQR